MNVKRGYAEDQKLTDLVTLLYDLDNQCTVWIQYPTKLNDCCLLLRDVFNRLKASDYVVRSIRSLSV